MSGYGDDLSLDSWDHNVNATSFNTVQDLLMFVSKCQPVIDQVLFNHNHDRITYFIDFYEAYKSQVKPLSDFYQSYKEKKLPDENRPDCIGRALKLKQLLIYTLSTYYKDAVSKLYVSNNTFDYHNLTLKISDEMERNHHYFVYFNEHEVLTLKFELKGRIGFVLFEMSFNNTVPVIVMLDNDYPSQGCVTLPAGRKATYNCRNEKYVEVFYDVENGCNVNKSDISVFRLTLYVGGSFSRFDISGKFCILQNLVYVYNVKLGNLLGRLQLFNGEEFWRMLMWDEQKKEHAHKRVPVRYFLQNEKDNIHEQNIDEIALLLQEDRVNVRNWMLKVSHIQQDESFLKQLYELPLSLREARQSFVCQEKD